MIIENHTKKQKAWEDIYANMNFLILDIDLLSNNNTSMIALGC